MGESRLEKKWRSKTPKSEQLTERAKKVMPGGETRSAVYHPPYSAVLDRGEGCRVWDVDGNEYLDIANNYTVLVHGHAYPPVVEAVTKAAQNGTTYTAKTMSQIELAELLVDRIASVDEVRYVNSGTEGVQAALMVARGFNGRSKILVSTYSYHGWFTESAIMPGSPGTSGSDEHNGFVDTYVAEWDNAEAFEKVLADHGDEIAAVLLEPWLASAGMVGASPEFFERVQAAATKAGAILILDEATVFRMALGGAQSLLGFQPDLSVLGKHVAGGMPGNAIGGRRDLMEILNPERPDAVHFSGTFAGNPVSTAAGLASLLELTEDRIQQMETRLGTIETEMSKSAARHGVPFSSRRVGSLMNVYMSDELPVANHVRADQELATKWHLACMTNGIFAVPRALVNVSTVTSDADVKEIIDRLDNAFEDLAAEI